MYITTTHHGHPVVQHPHPIELAIVPVKGEALHQSVVLHPRYVPDTVPHRKVQVHAHVRGRTIDLFLDEPLVIDGEAFGVLTFKGIGADADEELIINPHAWYSIREYWKNRHDRGRYSQVEKRRWGMMTEKEAKDEHLDTTLSDLNIPQIPHVGHNRVPDKIGECIRKQYNTRKCPNLGQLVRACKTNIRYNTTAAGLDSEVMEYIDPEALARIDAHFFAVQQQLAREGKMLYANGAVRDNRYIDGRFCDVENYAVRPYQNEEAAKLVFSVMEESLNRLGYFRLGDRGKLDEYVTTLKEIVGIGDERWNPTLFGIELMLAEAARNNTP